MTKKEALLSQYEKMKEMRISHLTLFLHMPGGETEIIKNPNVKDKIEYIKNAYDDNLVNKGCKDIYISKYAIVEEDDCMPFGVALELMKEGLKMRRRGWNGKGIYIQMQEPDEHSKMTLPYIYIVTNGLVTDNNDAPKGVIPWIASQTDMLANDWEIAK